MFVPIQYINVPNFIQKNQAISEKITKNLALRTYMIKMNYFNQLTLTINSINCFGTKLGISLFLWIQYIQNMIKIDFYSVYLICKAADQFIFCYRRTQKVLRTCTINHNVFLLENHVWDLCIILIFNYIFIYLDKIDVFP